MPRNVPALEAKAAVGAELMSPGDWKLRGLPQKNVMSSDGGSISMMLPSPHPWRRREPWQSMAVMATPWISVVFQGISRSEPRRETAKVKGDLHIRDPDGPGWPGCGEVGCDREFGIVLQLMIEM